jgi:hypothetical protein
MMTKMLASADTADSCTELSLCLFGPLFIVCPSLLYCQGAAIHLVACLSGSAVISKEVSFSGTEHIKIPPVVQ